MKTSVVAVIGAIGILQVCVFNVFATEKSQPAPTQITAQDYARECVTLFQSEYIKAKEQAANVQSCDQMPLGVKKPDAVLASRIDVRDAVTTVTIETKDGKRVTETVPHSAIVKATHHGSVTCWEDTHHRSCCSTSTMQCCWQGDTPLGCGHY